MNKQERDELMGKVVGLTNGHKTAWVWNSEDKLLASTFVKLLDLIEAHEKVKEAAVNLKLACGKCSAPSNEHLFLPLIELDASLEALEALEGLEDA